MDKVKSYKDLEVWQRSIRLVKHVYAVTNRLPKDEQYGLTSQIRRAAVSIPSNIAEGSERKGTKELIVVKKMLNGLLSSLRKKQDK